MRIHRCEEVLIHLCRIASSWETDRLKGQVTRCIVRVAVHFIRHAIFDPIKRVISHFVGRVLVALLGHARVAGLLGTREILRMTAASSWSIN